MPAWNWSTIRTFAHCANSSGTLSDQTLRAFARHDFVVFEKFQGKTMAPVNQSAEAKIAAAARQIKTVNTQAEVYMYTAVDFVRGYYDGWAWFDRHPTAELHDKDGRLVAASASVVSEWPGAHVFDFSQTEAQARWNSVVLEAIASGDLDGTYVDGIKSDVEFTRSLLSPASNQKRRAWLAGLNATMHALRVAVGSSKVLLQNSHSDWPRALDVRLQLGVGGKLDSTLSFQPGPTLLSDMQLVAATSPRIGAIYQSFAARGAVDDQMARYNTSLAAFLISMGPYSYWSYTPLLGAINRTTRRTMADGSWSCANWATPTGHEPDYLRPLGPPAVPAMQCQQGKCARRFESGTCAFLDTTPTGSKHARHTSCIWWADGTHVGNVCDHPKPAACKSLKTDDARSTGRGYYQAGVRVPPHWPADYQNGDRRLYPVVVMRPPVDEDPNCLLDFDDYGGNEPTLVKLRPEERRSWASGPVATTAVTAPFRQRYRRPTVSVTTLTGAASAGSAVARDWSDIPHRSYCSFVADRTNLNVTGATRRVKISVVSRISGVSYAASRMFEADYPVALSSKGTVYDIVDTGDTNVYALGDCTDVTRTPLAMLKTDDAADDFSRGGVHGSSDRRTRGLRWWLASPLTKVLTNSTKAVAAALQRIDLAGQQGESESWQVALRPLQAGLTLTAVRARGLPANVTLQWYKVVHVWCEQSEIYPLAGDRWLPDVLMPSAEFDNNNGAVQLEPGSTHSIWLKLKIGDQAAPGTANASITLHFKGSTPSLTVPLHLTIWPLKLPPLDAPNTFGTIFNLFYDYDRDGATDVAKYYGTQKLSPQMKRKYLDIMCENRVPADNCYRGGDLQDPARPTELPIFRPLEDYRSLAQCGARLFNLLDVSAFSGNGTMKMNYSQSELDSMVRMLEPAVTKLESLGLADRAYVYGFDERPVAYGHAMYQVFGSVKKKFPKLRTVAVLRWDPSKYVGSDLSSVLDIWVNLYSLWDEDRARAWTALGGNHEAWGYHCISPRPYPHTEPVKFLNTFIEDPAIDARLLSWWSLRYGAQGWLYYLVDGWQPSSPAQPNVPLNPPTHQPLRLREHSSLLTDFSPKRFNSKANAHPTRGGVAFSNGDGMLIWPGERGPLSSIRFENYRDGLEDHALLSRLSAAQGKRLVDEALSFTAEDPRSATRGPGVGVNVTVDAVGLERLRRLAAKTAMSLQGRVDA
jgi:hypothetical protein